MSVSESVAVRWQGSWLRALSLALIALCAVGCARTLTVRAPVLYPARVPVRAFPSIVVAGNVLPEGDPAERLRAYLAKDGKHEVRRVAVSELETLRSEGKLSPFTLVVVLVPGLYNDVRQDWQMVPIHSCDYYYGCLTSYQSVYSELPQLVGELTMTVYEGPSARVLQTALFEAAVYEPDSPTARKAVLEQLGAQAERAVDVIQSQTTVQLEKVDEHPVVKEAIALIQRGDWVAGRSLLEQTAQTLGGTKRSLQARFWYDLAIARWYAPGPEGLTQVAFERAQRALALAIERDARGRYDKALERLKLARQRQQILEEQRRIALENFALSGAPAPTP